MAKRREDAIQFWRENQSTPRKRSRNHPVSDSDDVEDYSDDESRFGGLGDPSTFLRQFGGYASDDDNGRLDQNSDEDPGR
jgi:hypothetical protein